MKCLTNIAELCFPEDNYELIGYDDGRCATSSLVLLAIFQRLQHFVTGGSMIS